MTDTEPSEAIDGQDVLDRLVEWFGTYVSVMNPTDLFLLALWVVHTHLAKELRTTPRLQLDSPLPESGKTTVLEHLDRLCHKAVLMSIVSSGALIPRMLNSGPRTILIDEAQRSLQPDKPGVEDIIATVTSGYRVGASRPVLVQRGKDWDFEEMSTFGPVAIAGISPRLPDDVISRIIRVLLMPDDTIKDTDWDVIETDAKALKADVERFADAIRETVIADVFLPEGCRGRMKEKWRPLKRLAVAAGGTWPELVDEMIRADIADREAAAQSGLRKLPPSVRLVLDLDAYWPIYAGDDDLVPTADLVQILVNNNPEYWGEHSPYGKQLTDTRFGHLMNQACGAKSMRPGGRGPRGFVKKQLLPALTRLRTHLADPLVNPVQSANPANPVQEVMPS